jgi:hypothetical protein
MGPASAHPTLPRPRHLRPRRSSAAGLIARPIRLTNVVVRRELLRGLGRLNATTTVLQRARLADPLGGMWEAADVQWWWRRPRATDELALPVWFDEVGPVAAAGLTAWDDTWQADVFAVPSIVDEEDVWAATLEATAGHRGEALQVLVSEDAPLAGLAMQSGFAMTDELSGTTWMDADQRPPVAPVDGFKVGFATDAARNLYLGAGFVQTSIDRLLVRPAPHEPCGQ